MHFRQLRHTFFASTSLSLAHWLRFPTVATEIASCPRRSTLRFSRDCTQRSTANAVARATRIVCLGDERQAEIRRDVAVTPRQTCAESFCCAVFVFARAPAERAPEHASVTLQRQTALPCDACAYQQWLVRQTSRFRNSVLAFSATSTRQARS